MSRQERSFKSQAIKTCVSHMIHRKETMCPNLFTRQPEVI